MNKKGFTLIELLAVIIILAILMIIAIPNILNTLATARRKSFVTQAQSIYKSAEQQFIIASMNNSHVTCYDDAGSNQLDLGSKSDSLKYYVKLNSTSGKVEELDIQDTAQGFKISLTKASGSDSVSQNDVSAASITTGATGDRSIKSCSGGNSGSGNSGSNSEPEETFGGTCYAPPSGNEEHSGLPATYLGICYLDPKNMSSTCNSNSTITSGNTGCKKFYVYDDDGSEIKLIMDRNTSENTMPKATTNEDAIPYWTSAEDQLAIDTAGWAGSPRLITAYEVADIVGYSNFTNASDYFAFGSKDETDYAYAQSSEQQAVQRSYYWLFDYTSYCIEYGGCEVEIDSYGADGYWTSTPVSGEDYYYWNVMHNGMLYNHGGGYENYFNGVRPVITLSKYIASFE